MQRRQKGVITVYLTFTLLIILSLLFVMLESARTAAWRFILGEAVRLSSDSVLADYNKQLYEAYHVFARETGAATAEGRAGFVAESFERFFSKNTEAEGAYLWKIKEANVTVKDCVLLTDYDGAFFRQQAAEYMEYRGVAAGVETLLEYAGLFAGTGETAKLLSMEGEVQDQLSGIDRETLKLMQYIDGLSVSDGGIETGITGKVKTEDSFVKKLLTGKPSMERVGVYVDTLYSALENKYEDPLIFVEEMESRAAAYEEAARERALKEEELYDLEQLLNGAGSEGETDDAGILELQARLLAVKGEILIIDGKIAACKAGYTSAVKKLEKHTASCAKATEKALQSISRIKALRDISLPLVTDFVSCVDAAGGLLDPGLFETLKEDAEVFCEYVGLSAPAADRMADIDGMEETLINNTKVLEELESAAHMAGYITNFSDVGIETFREIVGQYSFEKLFFDYTGVSLKSRDPEPLKGITDLLGGGIAGLILENPSEISEKEYTGTELPSDITGLSAEGGGTFSLSSSLELFRDPLLSAPAELLKNSVSELAEDALFLGYLFDSFGRFGTLRDETKCDYELEYILNGNLEDRTNLNATLLKIMAIRTVMCFIFIVSNRDMRLEAKAFATALLGVTGMPALVAVLQYTLILVWAAEEALIEMAALMKGLRVSAVPTRTGFALSFGEIFLISRPLIQEKAEQTASAAGLDYENYLLLLLMFSSEKKQNLRALDVIQENLRTRTDSFRMYRQLYGFNLDVEAVMPNVFPSFVSGYGIRIEDGARY